MSFRNSITIVASPRPRVGKTLLARLLADFHSQEGRTVAAFDLNSGEHTLAQFLPDASSRQTIADINGQMALFDRLVADDDATKVVDLGHESFKSFFAVAQQIGFVEEARRRGIATAILFVVTPDADFGGGLSQSARPISRRQRWRRCTTNCLGPRSIATNTCSPVAAPPCCVHLPVLAPGLAQVYRQAAILIRKFEYGERSRHSAR